MTHHGPVLVCKLHAEFKVPLLPPDVTGQNRGNSGISQQERYEIQVLDSWKNATYPDGMAGSVSRTARDYRDEEQDIELFNGMLDRDTCAEAPAAIVVAHGAARAVSPR